MSCSGKRNTTTTANNNNNNTNNNCNSNVKTNFKHPFYSDHGKILRPCPILLSSTSKKKLSRCVNEASCNYVKGYFMNDNSTENNNNNMWLLQRITESSPRIVNAPTKSPATAITTLSVRQHRAK